MLPGRADESSASSPGEPARIVLVLSRHTCIGEVVMAQWLEIKLHAPRRRRGGRRSLRDFPIPCPVWPGRYGWSFPMCSRTDRMMSLPRPPWQGSINAAEALAVRLQT